MKNIRKAILFCQWATILSLYIRAICIHRKLFKYVTDVFTVATVCFVNTTVEYSEGDGPAMLSVERKDYLDGKLLIQM